MSVRIILFCFMLSLLVGCLGISRDQVSPTSLPFEVTAESGGGPVFTQPDAGYPVSEVTVDSSYPVGETTAFSADGRSRTALDSFEDAWEVAKAEFDPNAYLVSISPSRLMIVNLSNPPVLPGWFFKFHKAESRREFIVQIIDNVVSGSTLTESAIDIVPKELAIDISTIALDSTEVLAKFQQEGGSRGLWQEGIIYDLELVNLEGKGGPTWLVVDPTNFNRLFAVHAITGEEVESPYQ